MSSAVRPATPQDLDRLEEIENKADSLLTELLRPEHWRLAPDAASRTAMGGFILVVAPSEDADAVGFVQVLEIDGNAHLEQLSVIPEHARHGFGRALVNSAKSAAARRGFRAITLRTFATVPWNGPFYATCGFVESQPNSRFHQELEQAELSQDSARYGRRIQMTALLDVLPSEVG